MYQIVHVLHWRGAACTSDQDGTQLARRRTRSRPGPRVEETVVGAGDRLTDEYRVRAVVVLYCSTVLTPWYMSIFNFHDHDSCGYVVSGVCISLTNSTVSTLYTLSLHSSI